VTSVKCQYQLCHNGGLSVLYSIRGIEKSRMIRGRQFCCFSSTIPWCKRKCETVHCRDATASSFIDKVHGEVFTHFNAVAVKHHSSIWNWLFGLPGRVLYEQSPWCERKRWACSWLFSSPVSSFSVSVSLEIPFKHLCTAHVFFPQHLSNHCQKLHCIFSDLHKIWCTLTVPLSDPIAKLHQAR
jgi:hypothetical protein